MVIYCEQAGLLTMCTLHKEKKKANSDSPPTNLELYKNKNVPNAWSLNLPVVAHIFTKAVNALALWNIEVFVNLGMIVQVYRKAFGTMHINLVRITVKFVIEGVRNRGFHRISFTIYYCQAQPSVVRLCNCDV